MDRITTLPSWLLTRSAAHAHRLVGDAMAEVGARGYHVRLLAALLDDGPASQADLGRRTGIHFSDMVATVTELVEGGYATRAPDPVDRRRNLVSATDAGRSRLEELTGRLGQVQDGLLAPLSDAERAELVRLLGLVVDHHQPGNPTGG